MENWQLTLIILSAVLAGALIPLFVMMTLAFYHIGREVARIGEQLNRSLATAEIVIQRAEVMSRGFVGHENTIPDLLKAVDSITHGLERNMRFINIFSTSIEAIVAAVRTYIATRSSPPSHPDDAATKGP